MPYIFYDYHTMKRARLEEALPPILVGAAAACVYLCLLSKRYVFEGLARAMPIDLGVFPETLQATYLLYGPLGWLFHSLVRAPLAVQSLQAMDALLGAAGISVFFLALTRLGLDRRRAGLWAFGLGTTLGWWMWSTDAQVYIFSAFTLSLCWLALVSGAPPWAVGLLHGLAVLAHVVNGVFGLVVLCFMRRRREFYAYALSAAALLGSAYGLAWLVVRPPDTRLWLLGTSFAGEGRPIWSGRLSPEGLLTWARTTVDILVVPGPARLLLLGLALYAAASLWRSKEDRPAVRACLAWIGAYALVFTSWQPHTAIYRTPDLLPLVTLLALGAKRLPVSALGAVLLAVALSNYRAEIKPRADVSTNERLARMALLERETPENAWIAVAAVDSGNDELYVPYFAHRKALTLEMFRGKEDLLRKRLTGAEPVYALPSTLEDPYWGPYLRSTTEISSTGSVLRLKGKKP
jgi:hypothetical protein